MPWSRALEDPIALPGGGKFVTLLDAGNYIASLPRKEAQGDHWQTATETLIMAAENRGPVMHARIGVMRALNLHVERVFTDRKVIGESPS
jgi:hypothetical protein